jgi:hypothetical protein
LDHVFHIAILDRQIFGAFSQQHGFRYPRSSAQSGNVRGEHLVDEGAVLFSDEMLEQAWSGGESGEVKGKVKGKEKGVNWVSRQT